MKVISHVKKVALITIDAATLVSAPSLYADESDELTKVNINTANAEQLALVLDGVGDQKAEAIVRYRETHGAFKSANDLVEVKGIGQSTLEVNAAVIEL